MAKKESQAAPQAEPAQEVDRIRDIIFGTQMQDYDGRFQTVQRDLDRLQQEIDDLAERLADQDSSQSKKLQNLRSEMRKADDDLREELRQTAQKLTNDKVDRMALAEMFTMLAKLLRAGGSPADLLKELAGSE